MAESVKALEINGLNVLYGHSHALQGVDLSLTSGIRAVLGRNGMGKTTLCNAIMGLVPISSGSIVFRGQSLIGRHPTDICRMGVAYVPQGRRLWRTLTVDEHVRLAARSDGRWTPERIFGLFPRLGERKGNEAGQLSGGEQQMLAIARALLLDPKLLVMDEPTEGLAPNIVSQVEEMLLRISSENDVDILLIEQNISVACNTSRQVSIMVNGRIDRTTDSASLSRDRGLQRSMLGVGRHSRDEVLAPDGASPVPRAGRGLLRIYVSNPVIPTRWSQPVPTRVIERSAVTRTEATPSPNTVAMPLSRLPNASGNVTLVIGTHDTKRAELAFIRDVLKENGLPVIMVDISTSGRPSGADVPPHVVAGYHPRGSSGVFTGDRGTAVAGMTVALERWMRRQESVAGIISAGGSGATAMVSPAMRMLPVGIPKLMVSTVASGDVGQYVGPSDMLMMHSVADIQGINSITRDVLSNAAMALSGMVKGRQGMDEEAGLKPAVGITMFGVTTACVRMITDALEHDYDCLVFHATGIGGMSMEKLLDSGRLTAIIDVTTTEICDMIAGGIFPAGEDRLGASIRTGIPYIGSCGALDMVNFAAPDTVPEHYRERLFYEHNPQITLMRTTPEENEQMGTWIGERLNRMRAPFRFYMPEGGVSELDREGGPFWDPAARNALFAALERTVVQGSDRQLVRVGHNLNDPEFVDQVISGFRELISGEPQTLLGNG